MTKNRIKITHRGVAQLVARDVWDVDAAGSNPVTPTNSGIHKAFGYQKIAVLTAVEAAGETLRLNHIVGD